MIFLYLVSVDNLFYFLQEYFAQDASQIFTLHAQINQLVFANPALTIWQQFATSWGNKITTILKYNIRNIFWMDAYYVLIEYSLGLNYSIKIK
jgi:hypothetical protein